MRIHLLLKPHRGFFFFFLIIIFNEKNYIYNLAIGILNSFLKSLYISF